MLLRSEQDDEALEVGELAASLPGMLHSPAWAPQARGPGMVGAALAMGAWTFLSWGSSWLSAALSSSHTQVADHLAKLRFCQHHIIFIVGVHGCLNIA